ncbi:hypothetical protein DUNSADRAFT_318 [Dunaliella salina]|uniref:Encoded protein n=1 Tax=Dunaliella salina TaxID=3046 RepID=A0ABQ7FZ68_DUNSA|nr:hypothetical protein DUNSADRAFT_318 [Dunaliella salina]|eukprot:KAF5827645.1 hypothetical protein DUNSADRAFT_318 [Dunaliella salina]
MSWKVTKAASLSNQGLGPIEAEAGPLMCQPSSASQAFTYYEPFSGQSSLDPSFSDNTASQSFMMSGFSQESLSISNASLGPQVRSHPFSSSSITSGRPSFTGSLPQGPTSN